MTKLNNFISFAWFLYYNMLDYCSRKWKKKADECAITLHIHSNAVRQEVRLMIGADLLVIIYLLFYGMIASTIINVALIIALAILLSKQQ